MNIARVHASLLLVIFSCAGGSAATFTANPIADAFVTIGPSANLSSNNYGGAGALSIAPIGSAKGEAQSVLRFDLSGALSLFDATFGAGQWTVQSVSLSLTAQAANNAIFNTPAAGQFGVSWMQNDSWVEGSGSPSAPGTVGITYDSLINTFINNGADQGVGAFSFSGGATGSFNYSLSLASGLLNDIGSGSPLSLRLFANDSTVSGVFPSRTFGTIASRPVLTVDAVAVPEPSTVALMLAGLGCFAGCRMLRHKQ